MSGPYTLTTYNSTQELPSEDSGFSGSSKGAPGLGLTFLTDLNSLTRSEMRKGVKTIAMIVTHKAPTCPARKPSKYCKRNCMRVG
mmetsp:Transcript_144551/g.277372  ORF Transcript_144551/g.277372 Transcript_144551/m.277372 type:complete len:85 (-) Transcript_144551:1253-1507(-)